MPQVKKESRREAILAVTLKEFCRVGIAQTRIEDIARLAGISKGLFYTYFENKEDAFRALLEPLLASYETGIRSVRVESAAALREDILQFAAPFITDNGFNKQADLLRLLWSEGFRKSDAVQGIYDKLIDIQEVFSKRLRQSPAKDIPQALKDEPLLIFSSVIHGVLWQGLAGAKRPFDLKRMLERQLEMMLSPRS